MTTETGRLILRPWAETDRAPFAEMSADPAVMQYLLPLPGRAASDAWIDRQITNLTAHGVCFWAVEAKAGGAFLGAVGLQHVGYEAHFTPAVEVGWRLKRDAWGRGYAAEAAAAALRVGFAEFGLPQIVANASPANAASRRVAERIGMTRDPADDFDHPRVPPHDPLRRQVLYRMSRDRWLALTAAAPV